MQIHPVTTKKDLADFIALPYQYINTTRLGSTPP